ncbi:MAG TPA: vitamin K epoxide reductase family protein [Gemmatimonadaceae bacterium]|nr:vitamin K epoxide reductase family protein [Gemmatimonadaceae bacterium]
MIYRRTIAILSLVAGMVALYLHLGKSGVVPMAPCSNHANGCEYVQMSAYGWFPVQPFMGIPRTDVALIGAVGYALIFITAILGTFEKWVDEKWPTAVLMVLIYGAMLFTLRLKYYEFFVLRGFCPWCLESALTITVCTVLVTLDWKRVRPT